MVEEYNSEDEFHLKLQEVVYERGAGKIAGIVWDTGTLVWRGVVVTQLQYGQAVYKFRVQRASNGYQLNMRGRRYNVVSDYFM